MTAPAQSQGRDWQSQVIRFTDQGVLLNVPPEIVPTGAFVVLTDVVANRDGTVQSAAGSVVLFTAPNTHSIRRFENHTTGETFYIVGVGTEIQQAINPGGFIGVIDTGFSGDPLTLVPYRIAILSNPYMYVGDSNKNIKIDTNATASKIGIVRPLPVLGQPALVATSTGAGNLTGDYDWRYTFARLIGTTVVAESNPSDVNPTPLTLASESATMPLVASVLSQGDITNIRVWRRGGTLPDAWRLVGTVADASAPFVDNLADIDIASAEILSLDNDLIGTSVDSSGTTLADLDAVPLPYLWGALEETLFGCGDPNRPDVVYYSKKGYPESWPAENTVSLDAPQDEAVCGLIYDGKSFVFTQEALYQLIPNIIDGLTWTPIKTPCGRGVVAPFAMCVGPKIWFVAKDGVYEWDGQGESRLISDALRPLFPYASVEGYTVTFGNTSYIPVDYGEGIQPNLQMRLTFHNGEVWFHYRDITGHAQTAVYNDEHRAWRFVAPDTYVMTYSDEPPQSVMLGVDLSGNTTQFTGGDRAGSPVSSVLMTGGHDQGFPRADKTYGDGALWMDVAGGSVTLTVYANSDFTTSVHGQVFTGGGLRKYIINLAGLYARHIAYQLTWDSTDAIQPVLYWIENTYLPLPEEITQRTTDWDDLGHPADKLVKGLLITADTRGNAIEINVEADGGTVYANFTIGPNTAGSPQTYNIGFAAFRARQVRIVPISTGEWKFYGINKWLFDAEPESLDCHDVYWGDGGYAHDKLIKGATIEADCQGVQRTLNVFDDQGVLKESLIIGPGIAGIPAIYELGFASFRTRNVRIMECSEDAAGNPVEPPVPCVGGIPAISLLDPDEKDAGDAEFTLTVNGSNFMPISVVSFNGTDLATTYVSAIQLTAIVPAALLVAIGTFDVVVTNPPPGCGPSAPFPFEVTCAGDIPVILDLDPPSATVGGPTFTLTITGTGFRSDATATFNGVDVPVTFINSTTLEAEIVDTLIAAEGTYEVIVTNPPPGCGPSNPFEFEVTDEPVFSGLRFIVDESNWVDPENTGTETGGQFRIQQMGSSTLYRMILPYNDFATATGQTFSGGFPVTSLLYRLSKDATKLAVCWRVNGDSASFYVTWVFDLGQTLSDNGPFNVPLDILLLDAPIISEYIVNVDDKTIIDIAVDNDGNLTSYEEEIVADVVQNEFTWTQENFIDADVGYATRLTVFADSRSATMTSVAPFTVQSCCSLTPGSGPVEVDFDPTEAWWSPDNAHTEGACAPASGLGFCAGIVLEDQGNCTTDSIAEAVVQLTIDRTGLANGTYNDANVDHPGTPILTITTNSGGSPLVCGSLTAPPVVDVGVPERTFQTSMIQTPLTEIRLTVGVPTTLKVVMTTVPAGGSPVEAAAYTFLTNSTDDYLSDSVINRILNADENLIVYRSQAENGAVRVFNVATGVPLLLVPFGDGFMTARPAPSDQPYVWSTVSAVEGNRNAYCRVGEDSETTEPDPFISDHAYILQDNNGTLTSLLFTNTVVNLTPEYQYTIRGTAYLTETPNPADPALEYVTPLVLFTGNRTGYVVGGPTDNVVRTLSPGVADDEITADGGPFDPAIQGDLVVSPGETDPSRVRAIPSEFIGLNEYSDRFWNPFYPVPPFTDPICRPRIVALGIPLEA